MNEQIQEIRYQVGEAWKGTYNPATVYGNANVVQDPTGLSVYRSLKPGNVGHALSETSWWFKIIDLSSIKEAADNIAATDTEVEAHEAARVSAEQQRVSQETARVNAETARIQAEQTRASQESERVSQEQTRVNQEQVRVSQEETRRLAENSRLQAEEQRAAKEQQRVNAEQQRALAEQNRAAAEQNRIESELTRMENEQNRLQRAEADHQTAVQDNAQMTELVERADADHAQAASDHTTAVGDHTTAAADHTQAVSDHTIAASDHTRAESDHTTATTDHDRAESDHSRAESDHSTAETDHATYASNVHAAQVAAQQAEAAAETSTLKATAAAESAATTAQYVEDIKDSMEQLPDGQAVSAQVAVNKADIAALQDIVADIETIAEGYVRVAGSSSPALSYRSYKYHEQGGFGRESVFSLFYPCLVGTKLSGDDAQVGTVLYVLKKLGARLATAEDTAFTEGQAVWEDVNGNLHAIDGSEGDVLICNIEPYYSIDGKHTIDGTEYDVFLKSRTPFTWQGIEAVMIDKMGMSPDYCVSHQDTDDVVRMHSVYNPEWNGSYQAPVGVAGKYVYTTDPETGDIIETYDAEATLLGGAGGLHSTDISLPDGEQRAMNMNPDTTKTVPFMNQTAEACNRMQAILLSEGGTFDAHNANLMGSGFSSNDGATAAGDWEQAGSGAKNGLRVMDKDGAWKYYSLGGNVRFLTGHTEGTEYAANVINSWRNPWHVMEAQRAVSYAVQNDVHELEWFVFEGNKYKYRSVQGFNGPSHGEMTCVVWKLMATQAGANAIDPTDNATSIAGNRVEILVSTALIHGVTTQVSPSWWVSGLIFTEDENGQYECYLERDQHALLKSPAGDYAADQVIPFEEHYEHLVTIQKGEGYARNYHNDALMMPDTNANKSGAGLHTYVGKYNWFTGGNAPAGKKGVRGFRRGAYAYHTPLSPLSMFASYSPSNALSFIGFGTCCSLR